MYYTDMLQADADSWCTMGIVDFCFYFYFMSGRLFIAVKPPERTELVSKKADGFWGQDFKCIFKDN